MKLWRSISIFKKRFYVLFCFYSLSLRIVPNDKLNKKQNQWIQSYQLQLHNLKKFWRWNGDFKSKQLMNTEGKEEGQ